MNIIKRKTLLEFWEKHPDSEQAVKTWYAVVRKSSWREPAEIKKIFATADFLSNNRVCFNIKGNKYRLIVKIIYELQRVYVRFIGTHAEYDKIDANNI
ncbi:type II toxin-antitoxin system HigB family toxin [Candidatus Electronema sp. PJ]|uniref:type II toxin-antitoxin system HigB family toxin n=1 Tax=Candidatus Electronema sp. PJ TaxID=3401572 RepID=UPI003AA9AB78